MIVELYLEFIKFASVHINKTFIQVWNKLTIKKIKSEDSTIKNEDFIICEQCEKYMDLIDHNFHDEAEILGECGSCEIYN